MRVVRREQKMMRAAKNFRLALALRVELIQRVELKALDPGCGKQKPGRQMAADIALDLAIGAGVAIGDGRPQQRPAFVDQHIIDAPGVRTDTRVSNPRRTGGAQGSRDLPIDRLIIPDLPLAEGPRRVFKPREFSPVQSPIGQRNIDQPNVRSAVIER